MIDYWYYWWLIAAFSVIHASDQAVSSELSANSSFLDIFNHDSIKDFPPEQFDYGNFDLYSFVTDSPLSVQFEISEAEENALLESASNEFFSNDQSAQNASPLVKRKRGQPLNSENALKISSNPEVNRNSLTSQDFPSAGITETFGSKIQEDIFTTDFTDKSVSTSDIYVSSELQTSSSDKDQEVTDSLVDIYGSGDYDSSSDFGSIKARRKRKRPSRNGNSSEKKQVKIARTKDDSETELTTIILKTRSTKRYPNRPQFCNRTPFLYKTNCPCEKKLYNYISPALKHMSTVHEYNSEHFTDAVELIDDFGVIQNYPFKCELCPFRTNKSGYLLNHKFHNHNISK